MDLLEALGLVASVLTLASFLALVNERLIEFLVRPWLTKLNLGDYIAYVALLTGGLISAGFGLDIFGPVVEAVMGRPLPVPFAGHVLTAIVVGGGSNLLHDIWPVPTRTATMTQETTVTVPADSGLLPQENIP